MVRPPSPLTAAANLGRGASPVAARRFRLARAQPGARPGGRLRRQPGALSRHLRCRLSVFGRCGDRTRSDQRADRGAPGHPAWRLAAAERHARGADARRAGAYSGHPAPQPRNIRINLERSRVMPMSGLGVYDPNNIFARILRGEIPSRRVYEDEFAVAFHDIAPQAPLHVLVIPRGQYVSLADFTAGAT